jgi:hypothetical protein
MKIQANQQAEQELAIQFKILALNLFKILSLPEIDRGIERLVYLNKVYEKIYNFGRKFRNIKPNE